MARRPTKALAVTKPDPGALTAERAYFKAERRGFVPGHELEDWLAAEREVAALLGEPPPEVAPAPLRSISGPRAERRTAHRRSSR